MMLNWKLLGILVLYLCAGGNLGTEQGVQFGVMEDGQVGQG